MTTKILLTTMHLCLGLCLGTVVMAQTPTPPPHVLQGRIWDTRAQQFITEDALYHRAAVARYVLLGEKHDSEAHHARQLDVLKGLAALGAKPALAMEQMDSEHQAALTQAQGAGQGDAEALADAGQLNRKGWRWPMYKDLMAFAAQHRWPLRAANLSRTEARKIALGERTPNLPAATPEQQAALENDVVQGHCGYRPETARLNGIVAAQRARDARMAQTMDAVGGPVVLIAGAGHVRADRAVPRYLAAPAQALSIAMVETVAGQARPADYDRAGFDVLWFTAAGEDRPDPCATPLPGLAAPAAPGAAPSASPKP
nr:ChaN family lipoprotein [uncultured Rhodoferax sp.]